MAAFLPRKQWRGRGRSRMMRRVPVLKLAFLDLLRLYRRILSPMLGNVCRFEPSCSRYASQCIERHGALVGSLLSAVRLCKCHPFHPGGFDPPPSRFVLRWKNNPAEDPTQNPPRELASPNHGS
jgi:putative membrane protein insertion efficiency factor